MVNKWNRLNEDLAEVQAENERLRREVEELKEKMDEHAYARITELIGELSWGIDIPSPMEVVVAGPVDPDPMAVDVINKMVGKKYAVRPESYEPVFNAIYQKLKKAPLYNPLYSARKEAGEQRRLKESANQHIKELSGYLRESTQILGEYLAPDGGTHIGHVPSMAKDVVEDANQRIEALEGALRDARWIIDRIPKDIIGEYMNYGTFNSLYDSIEHAHLIGGEDDTKV